MLVGSVQRGGNRLRVNVQLIDAETASHIWVERFDKPVADLFDMQDEIVSRIANALNANLLAWERHDARNDSIASQLPVDLYFRGRASLHQWARLSSLENLVQARRFFEQAKVLDPKNIYAIFGVASVDVQIAEGFYNVKDKAARLAVAEEMMVQMLPHVPNVALAHQAFGQLLILTNRAAHGIAECERALVLDRNCGAHILIGKAKSLLGRSEETEAHINEALRLFPRHLFTHFMLLIGGSPNGNFLRMPKPSIGCDAASKRTALIPSHILYTPLHWRYSVRWTRRWPLRRRDLRSIQASQFVATAMANRVITRLTSPHRSASIKECGWQGYRRGDIGFGCKAEAGARRPRLAIFPQEQISIGDRWKSEKCQRRFTCHVQRTAKPDRA